MRLSTFTLGLFLASVLGLTMTPSRAAEHEDCEKDGRGCEEEKQNCQELLDNRAYRCEVKADFGPTFTDCFQFISPGQQSLDFDLAIAGLGQTLSCACKAGGSFRRPQFAAARDFHCVTPAFTSFGIAFEGQVKEPEVRGPKVREQEAEDQAGAGSERVRGLVRV